MQKSYLPKSNKLLPLNFLYESKRQNATLSSVYDEKNKDNKYFGHNFCLGGEYTFFLYY